jgi:hypothetical protein
MGGAIGENFRQQLFDAYESGKDKMAGVPEIALAVAQRVGPGLSKERFVEMAEAADRANKLTGQDRQQALQALVQEYQGKRADHDSTPNNSVKSLTQTVALQSEQAAHLREMIETLTKSMAGPCDQGHNPKRDGCYIEGTSEGEKTGHGPGEETTRAIASDVISELLATYGEKEGATACRSRFGMRPVLRFEVGPGSVAQRSEAGAERA